MKHLDLFSGIGGFALATEMVWDNVEHTFVEYDPFCQEILKKHWPEAEIHGDIRAFANASRKQADAAKQTGLHAESGLRDCDIITGGFPCQPFSQAGRRKGTADDRYLWPPMLECIALYRPRWVIAENVAGLASWDNGVVLETVCADLEKEGYEVQTFVIPAVAVGAPHRRDRIWIVAHRNADSDGRIGWASKKHTAKAGKSALDDTEGRHTDGSDASDTRLSHGTRGSKGMETNTAKRSTRLIPSERSSSWNENWLEVATRLCRVDARVSTWVDGRGKVRNSRNARLKALGNAIVPQVAAEIMRAIKSNEMGDRGD